jgi:hypothetical protein
VSGWASSLDNRVEAVVIIGCIIDCPNRTVRFKDAVGPSDLVTISLFPLALEVACMMILHAVIEMVSGISL